MVFKRKEAKDYGCKKMVEGVYNPNDKCLLIEDVVVYGTSIIETAQVSCCFIIILDLSFLEH
jgi:uridine monophosphate synthetase